MPIFQFPVNEVRTFSYPALGARRLLVEVPIQNLPPDLPTEPNARAQNLKTAVAKAIARSLTEEGKADIFHLLNRGIVIAVARAEFDTKSRLLTLEFSDSDLHGVLDGGHTYEIIKRHADTAPAVQVTVEVLVGVEDYQADIVEARNTSVQVDQVSLANIRDEFDDILNWLDNRGIPRDRIGVKQNENKDIPMLDILTIMYLFDVDTFGNGTNGLDRPPTLAYSAKSSVLRHFQRREHQNTYTVKMLPLLPDILYLWDYIALRLPHHYRAGTGKEYGRVGGRRGNKAEPIEGLFMPGVEVPVSPHRAYRLPLIAALRCFVDNTGPEYGWVKVRLPTVPAQVERELGRPATAIERFYEKVAEPMHRVLWAAADSNTPNKLGKTAMLWNNLYMIAWRELELLKVTT